MYRTGSPTHSEFMRIRSTACDRNQVAYCSHSKAHNFAQESPIEKIKVPFWSAINVFSDGILILASTKCGKWVVYGKTVTYALSVKPTQTAGMVRDCWPTFQYRSGLHQTSGWSHHTCWDDHSEIQQSCLHGDHPRSRILQCSLNGRSQSTVE